MPRWKLYYHFVWATKERQPWLTAEVEKVLYPVLVKKSHDMAAGISVLAADGVADHVHVIVSLPPSISPAQYAQQIKGATSFVITTEFDLPFAWQRGYGVFSVSEKLLQQAVSYVQGQKAHHAEGTTIRAYETFDS